MLRWSRDFMLERMRASDPAFDGKFLTGVLTTGIYCLPSCKGRKPKDENVVFVASAEEARALGLRPCLRCRPDDHLAGRDPDHELVVGLLARLRRDVAAVTDVAELARVAGWGATRLHGLLRQHLHLSPAGLLERERAAAASERLLFGDQPPADVAFAVGYRSLSTFHQHLRVHTGLAPGELRRLRDGGSFVITLPGDLRVEDTLRVLGRDPESASERRRGREYVRALTLDGSAATVTVSLAEDGQPGRGLAARCAVATRGHPSPRAMAGALAATLAWFGLPADPRPFERRVAARNGHSPEELAAGAGEDDRLASGIASLVAARPGLRVPRMSDGWEALVWAVLGQQVNLAFAMRLRRALVERLGSPAPGGLIAPPGASAVAAADPGELVALGLSRRKAEVLIDLARAVASGALPLSELGSGTATAAERSLLAQRGVGPWTAAYVAMRGLGFLDALPVGDSGLATTLGRLTRREVRPDPAEQRRLAAPFAPYRSLLTMHLWLSLGDSP